MSVAISCGQCGEPMQWTGVRGLCPRCLFACTTNRVLEEGEAEPSEKAAGLWHNGMPVGAGDRFLLLDKLGEGGMGEVWLADDRQLSEPDRPEFVALKFLSAEIQHDARALTALRGEVLRCQRLAHPNIVRIFDLHTSENGTPFIKMEFVEGNSLRRWLADRPNEVMPWRMAATIAQQLASALHYAYQTEGIVHRDLKPANILIGTGMVIKLSDFGISSAVRDRADSRKSSLALGTLAYASPQQLARQQPRPEDDVYSFGVTLYELLTGSLPIEAASAAQLVDKVMFEPPQNIPDRLRTLGRSNPIPSKMLLLVMQCLEKDRLLRPTMPEIIRRLPPISTPDGSSQPAREAPWRKEVQEISRLENIKAQGSPWPALLLLALLAGLTALSWWQNWGGLWRAH